MMAWPETNPPSPRRGIVAQAWMLAPVVVPVGLAYGAVLAALWADPFSSVAYWLPLGVPAVAGVALLVVQSCRGRPVALIILLGIVTVGLSLSFRTRELGDVGLDAQNGAKLATWAVILAVALVRLPRIWPLLTHWPMACLLAYCAMGMLSALWSEVPLYSFGSAFGLTAFVLFGAVLAQAMPQDRLMRVLAGWLGLYVAINLLSLVALPAVAVAPPSAEEVAWRVRGVAGHPNVLGHQMVVALLLAATGAMCGWLGPRWAAVLAVGGAGLLVASGSRTSLITGVAVLALVWLRRRPTLLIGGGVVAVVVAGTLLALPSDMVRDLFSSLSRSGDASEMTTLTGRTDIWDFGMDKISRRPWFGYGYNGAEPILTRELVTEDANATVNLHNMYLQSLFCVGLVGSLPLVGLWGGLAGRFVTRPNVERDTFFLCQIFTGLAEVEAFGGTPGMMTLVLIILVALPPPNGAA